MVQFERFKQRRSATTVGLERTRGDPIGLAGRRRSHSAKVWLPTIGLFYFVLVFVWVCVWVPCGGPVVHCGRVVVGQRRGACSRVHGSMIRSADC